MAFGLDAGSVYAHVRADTVHFMKGMAAVEKRVSLTAAKISVAGGRMIKTFGLIGGAVSLMSLKAFASFDDAMTRSTAIMGDLEKATTNGMKNIALSLSMNGVQSAKQLAESYFFLASAGLDAQQSMAALPQVQKFATAGAFDMAQATDLLTDAQSALGLTVKDAQKNLQNMTRLSDVLVKANTLANASTEQFSKALTSKAGPAMKALNISLEEGTAVLAAYADQGIKAEEAGNAFSRMLRLMIKGFIDNNAAWKQMNLTIENSDGTLRPMADIVRDLTEKLKDMSPTAKAATLQMLGFQARAQDAILPLLGTGDAIEEYHNKLKDAAGTTEDVSEKQLKSFGNQWRIVWNNIKAVGIVIGEVIAGYLPPLAEFFKSIAEWIVDNKRLIQEWIDAIAKSFKWLYDGILKIRKFVTKQMTASLTMENAIAEYRKQTGDLAAFTQETVAGGFGAAVRTIPPKHKEMWEKILKQQKEYTAKYEESFSERDAPKITGGQAPNITAPNINLPELSTPTVSDLAGKLTTLDDLEDMRNSMEKAITTYEEASQVMDKIFSGLNSKGEQYFDFMRDRLESDAENWSKHADVIASKLDMEEEKVRELIAAYVEYQNKVLDIQEAREGDNFFKGIAAGIEEAQMNMQTWGETGFQTVQAGMDSVASSLSGVIQGTNEWKDIWTNLGQTVMKVLADMAAKMAVMGIVGGIMGGGGFGGGLLGGLFGDSGTTTGAMSSGGTPMNILNQSTGKINIGMAHSGGIVGTDVAVKAHDGLMPNERKIIALKNEGVFTEAQMKALGESSRKDKTEDVLRQILGTLQQRQNFNMNIIDQRDLITAQELEGRRGEEMVMRHVNVNQEGE